MRSLLIQVRVLEIGVILLLLAVHASAVYFVWRDADRRGIDSAPWVLLVIFLPFVGISAYVVRVVMPNRLLRKL